MKSTMFMTDTINKSNPLFVDLQQNHNFMSTPQVQPKKAEKKEEKNMMLPIVVKADNPAIFWFSTELIHRCLDVQRKHVCVGTS